VIGAHQADSLKDHTHLYNNPVYSAAQTGDGTPGKTGANGSATGSPSTGAAAETARAITPSSPASSSER